MKAPFSMGRLVLMYRWILRVSSPQRFLTRRFIARHLPSTRARCCLDVGAGTSPFADDLARALPGLTYVSIDIAPSDRTAVVADAALLPFGSERVDLVALFHCLQHLPDAAVALAEGVRVLKPGGHILITYPFLISECDLRDFRRWTREGMDSDLRRAGLEPVAHRKLGGPFLMACGLVSGCLISSVAGGRKSWRAPRTLGGVVWVVLVLAITLPFNLLGFLALLLDQAIDDPAHYGDAVVLARKPLHG